LTQASLTEKFYNAEQYGKRTWSLLNTHRGNPKIVNTLLYLADTLETHTTNLLDLYNIHVEKQLRPRINFSPTDELNLINEPLQNFYRQPILQLRKKHKSSLTIRSQLLSNPTKSLPHTNHSIYYFLQEEQDEPTTMTTNESSEMEEDTPHNHNSTGVATTNQSMGGSAHTVQKKTVSWITDSTISQLTASCLHNLIEEQTKLHEAGEDLQEATQYKIPSDGIDVLDRNYIRLSIKRARNSDPTVPTIKAFKSFSTALKSCDKTLAILPVSTSKQNISALTTSAQISSVDNNKLFVYFKSYYPKQKHSLSGYIYISTQLSFEDLMIAQPIYEWLEINRYTIRTCPNTGDEMVQIGALCFSSDYIYRDDLKEAIQTHPSWSFPSMENPPVFQLTRGDFRGPQKSTKMIFIQAERSTQHLVGEFFSKMYDGSSKPYPNGIMMLFIPLYDNIQHEPAYRQKVIYNHERYIGEEEAICIHGLQNPNIGVKLKNGQNVTLRMLLHSIPATQGMSRPQLFQNVETTNNKDIIIATYQKGDLKYINERKLTLETDLKAQLSPESAADILVSEEDGLWFSAVTKTKHGQIIPAAQTSKMNLEYIQYTNSVLSSPPKKRTHTARANQHQPTNIGTYAAATQRTNHPHHQVETTRHLPPQHASTKTTFHPHQHITTTLPEEIHQRFMAVENDMKAQKAWNQEQKEWNASIDHRMDYLEDTTTSTDLKVDTILSKLDSWDIPTKRNKVNSQYEDRSHPYSLNPQYMEGVTQP